MDAESDDHAERWLRLAANGDQEAWRRLIEEFSPRVFGLLRSKCRDADLAEELTQSTFATVALKLSEYVEQGRFESWVFRIAINRLRDEMRRRTRHARPTPDEALARISEAPPEGGGAGGYRTVEPIEVARLNAAMAELAPADREIIDMRFIAGLSFAQMATILDEPIGTLLARNHRALAKLRKAIERASKGGQ
ncbi:MAG: RNA polymerase sigma factor [Phycisphaerales bacterium]|nr:RNA polymerase sigma factor [Phycisphaerales bacterium]